MILRKLSIVLILIVLLSFGEAKDECPLQCDCSEDFSVVRCRGLEKFPVFGFASKVKTLDVTYGNIKYIHEKDVKAYTNLENLFISHNPLDCDHATTYTLKHFLKEKAGLKAFDGHKIKCQRMMPMPLVNKDTHGKGHHPYNLPGPHIHFHPGSSLCYSPLMVAGAIVITIFALLAVAGVCWVIVNYRHKLFSARGQDSSNAQDTVIQMEEGHGDESDTAEQALIKGLKKQRRGTQGYPENAIVDSDEDDVVEQEDYIKEKMKKQRRFSQGYAASSGSSDEESTMVEINLNEDLYASRK